MNQYDWTIAVNRASNDAFYTQLCIFKIVPWSLVILVLNELFSGTWFMKIANFSHYMTAIVYAFCLFMSLVKVPGIFLLSLWRTWCMPRYEKDALLAFK